jgi:hypothetical protein
MKKLYSLLRPKFVGERFEQHSIPLDILRDLSVLEEMVIEAAKWRYHLANPDRKRSPRGFTDDITISLTDLSDGSAVPDISLAIEQQDLIQPAKLRYFQEAFTSISDAIDAAANDEPINEHLPDRLLSYFDRFGRNLRDTESIQMRPDNAERPARLTQPVRRRLVLASSKVQELTEEVSLRGRIPEADQSGMTFEIEIIGGPKIEAPLEVQYFDTIIDAFNGYQEHTKVILQGVARYNRFNKIRKMDSIEHVNILDPNDVGARIQELKGLKDGWLDGEGVAPSDQDLDWMLEFLNKEYPDELPLPYIFPTPEGGVQLEWTIGSYDVSLDVDLSEKTAAWNEIHTETMEITEFEVNLNDAKSWEHVKNRISEMAGAGE